MYFCRSYYSNKHLLSSSRKTRMMTPKNNLVLWILLATGVDTKLDLYPHADSLMVNINKIIIFFYFFLYIQFFKNLDKIKLHLYDHRGVHTLIFVFMNRFQFIDITLLHYYSINTLFLQSSAVCTAAVYKCSAKTCVHSVFTIRKR